MPVLSEVPLPTVSWSIDPARAVVLVHDLQRYFLAAYDDNADPLRTLLGNARRLIEAARAAGVPVVYTAQPHAQPASQRGLLADVWGPGIQDPDDARIADVVAPAPGEEIVTRTRYNAFLGSTLDDVLSRLGRDQIVLTGVYAHIGCQVTAAHAFMTERQVFPVADAQADFSRRHHDDALAWLAGRAAHVTDTESVLAAFGGVES
jgi:bifunctional isochorismate lyase/aryl carrier protein